MSGSDDDKGLNPFAGLDPRVLQTEKDDGVKDALNTLLGATGGTGKPTGTVPRQTRNSQKTGAGVTIDPPPVEDPADNVFGDHPEDVPLHLSRLRELKRAVAELKTSTDLAQKRLEREDFDELEKDIEQFEMQKGFANELFRFLDNNPYCQTKIMVAEIQKLEKAFRTTLRDINTVRVEFQAAIKKRQREKSVMNSAKKKKSRKDPYFDDDSEDEHDNEVNAFRLPRLKLPTFTGEDGGIDWDSFSDIFNATVMENRSLTDSTRHQYLRSCLGGKAAKLVQGYDHGSANLENVWQSLDLNFGNRRRSINKVVNTMLDHPGFSKGMNTVAHLRSVLDVFKSGERMLDKMGFSSPDLGIFLIPICRLKLPYAVQLAYEKDVTEREERELGSASGGIPYRQNLFDIKAFFAFLSSEVRALENLNPKKASGNDNSKKKTANPQSVNATSTNAKNSKDSGSKNKKKKNNNDSSTSQNNSNSKQNSNGNNQAKKSNNASSSGSSSGKNKLPCPWCDSLAHSPFRCGLIPTGISVVDRFQRCLAKNRCVRCLKVDDAEHKKVDCGARCKICGDQSHSWLLHGHQEA